MSRKSNRDSVVRFVTAKSSAVRFVTAKRGPERATKTRQYDLVRPNMGQKEPPKLGSRICYGQDLARKSHQDSAVRFVTAKRGPERATKTRQYGLLRPTVGQKEPPRLGSTICYGQEFGQKEPPRLGSTICYGQELARKSHQDCPEKAAKTRQNDLLRRRAGKKGPLRIGSTFCSGQTWARKSHQDSAVRFVTAKTLARKSHRDSAVRLVTAKSWPEKATKTRQYGQKEPPRLGSTICYGQELARKSHRDSARLVTAKRGPERATKTRQFDLLLPRVGQKESPRLGSTIPYRPDFVGKSHQDLAVRFDFGQKLARKSHQDSAVRFVTAKS